MTKIECMECKFSKSRNWDEGVVRLNGQRIDLNILDQ